MTGIINEKNSQTIDVAPQFLCYTKTHAEIYKNNLDLHHRRNIEFCSIGNFLSYAKNSSFFDTIFTVAVVFYCGLVPALCVSIGYNLINSLIWIYSGGVSDPFIFFYSICGILIVLST